MSLSMYGYWTPEVFWAPDDGGGDGGDDGDDDGGGDGSGDGSGDGGDGAEESGAENDSTLESAGVDNGMSSLLDSNESDLVCRATGSMQDSSENRTSSAADQGADSGTNVSSDRADSIRSLLEGLQAGNSQGDSSDGKAAGVSDQSSSDSTDRCSSSTNFEALFPQVCYSTSNGQVCQDVASLSSGAPECATYGGYLASPVETLMCNYMPNTTWDNFVRGCLVELTKSGQSEVSAHVDCISAANNLYGGNFATETFERGWEAADAAIRAADQIGSWIQGQFK